MSRKTLGGSTFVRLGEKFDYCYKESILTLLEFCDKVSCVVVLGEDNTHEELKELESNNPKLIVTYLPEQEWFNQHGTGSSKLCYFSDIAISKLDTDYNYYQQADEVTHEKCFDEMNSDYPLQPHYIDLIKNEIIKELVARINLLEDEQNNSDDN